MCKRLMVSFFTLCAVAFLLSGCGGKNETTMNDDPAKEEHLVWYTIGDQPKDYDKVIAEVNKYLKEKINATVEIKFVGFGDYDQKMTAASLGGDYYDICYTTFWTFDYRRGARQNLFYPLGDLIARYGEGITKSVDVMPKLLEATRINGEIYCVPVTNAAYQTGYFFDKNIAGKYNFDYTKVQRVADLFPLFEKIKTGNPGVTCISGLKEYNADNKFDWIMGSGFPGAVRVDDQSCKVINQYTDPDYITVLQDRREAYKKGYTYREQPTISQDNAYKTGKLASFINVCTSNAECVYNLLPDFPPTAVYFTYPRAVADTRNAALGSTNAISARCKNPVRAMKFINLLYSDPYLYNLLLYGMENVYYKKIGNGPIIEFLPKHQDYTMQDWVFGGKLIGYIPKGEPADKWQKERQSWNDAVWSPIFGFSPDLTSVQTEISAMTNVMKQYETDLQMGSRDIEPLLKEMNEKLKAAGLDKFIAEIQKQADVWKQGKK